LVQNQRKKKIFAGLEACFVTNMAQDKSLRGAKVVQGGPKYLQEGPKYLQEGQLPPPPTSPAYAKT